MTVSTSFFSADEDHLDPRLFVGERLRDDVRMAVLSALLSFLHSKDFHAVEVWLEAWLAGSGVAYNWGANREPGDLDCLLGIHYVQFREANPQYAGLSNNEIASMLNDMMWAELLPTTANFMGEFELTYYVNPDSTDIRNIHPYAAYDLRNNEWTVHPVQRDAPPSNKAWDLEAQRDNIRAQEIVARYNRYMDAVQNAQNDAHRANAETYLHLTLSQAKDLYEEIHQGRKAAFSRTGAGYTDRGNYRWQSGKATGTVPALKHLAEYYDTLLSDSDHATYGIDLPDANTLIMRAALWEH